jgi:hypothetical protein
MDAAGQGGQDGGTDGIDQREDRDELSGHLQADRKIPGDLREDRGDHESFCSDREGAEREAAERRVPDGSDLESAVAHAIHLFWIRTSRHSRTEHQHHYEPFSSIWASGEAVQEAIELFSSKRDIAGHGTTAKIQP